MLIDISKFSNIQEKSEDKFLSLRNLYYIDIEKIKTYFEEVFDFLIDKEYEKFKIVIEDNAINFSEFSSKNHVIYLKFENGIKKKLVSIPYIDSSLDTYLNDTLKYPVFSLSNSCINFNDSSRILTVNINNKIAFFKYEKNQIEYSSTKTGGFKTLEKWDIDFDVSSNDWKILSFYFKHTIYKDLTDIKDFLKHIENFYITVNSNDFLSYRGSLVFKKITSPIARIFKEIKKYYKHLQESKYKNYINSNSKLLIITKHINKIAVYVQNNVNSNTFFALSNTLNNVVSDVVKQRIIMVEPGTDQYRVSETNRLFHNSMIGKICCLDTPEGKSFGLNMGLANGVGIDENGIMYSNFFNINKKKIEKIYTIQEKDLIIADYIDYYSENEVIYLRNKSHFVRDVKTKAEYLVLDPSDNIAYSMKQNPLIQFNDPARCVVANSVNKQYVTTLNTGRFIYQDLNTYRNSKIEPRTSKNTIKVDKIIKHSGSFNPKLKFLDTDLNHLASSVILAAPMHVHGWCYEDSICVSDHIIDSEQLTSEQNVILRILVPKDDDIILTKDIPNNEKKTDNLDSNGIIKQGVFFKGGDLLVGMIQKKKIQNLSYLEDILNTLNIESADYANISHYASNNIVKGYVSFVTRKNVKDVTDIKQHIDQINEYYDDIIDKYKYFCLTNKLKIIKSSIDDLESERKERLNYLKSDFKGESIISIGIQIFKKPQVGDKFSSLHGNKGTLARIIPREDCPIVNDGTGRTIDIMFNSISIQARLNIGFLWEIELGRIKYELEKLDTTYVLEKLDKLGISYFDDSNMEVNFLGSAFNIDIQKILSIKNIFNIEDVKLINGLTMQEYEKSISFGYIHVVKTCHFVSDKISSRSSGVYSMLTQQPTASKASYEIHGSGIRIGEMEHWAILAWNCPNFLIESFTVKSDDMLGRMKYHKQLLRSSSPIVLKTAVTESLKIYQNYLLASGIKLIF